MRKYAHYSDARLSSQKFDRSGSSRLEIFADVNSRFYWINFFIGLKLFIGIRVFKQSHPNESLVMTCRVAVYRRIVPLFSKSNIGQHSNTDQVDQHVRVSGQRLICAIEMSLLIERFEIQFGIGVIIHNFVCL